MAKKEVFQPLQHWLIVELSEYFTLRNRGLLHTIPTSRYVDTNATYRDWYRALPPGWDNGRYFVVRAIRPMNADVALRFQDVEVTTFYALQPEPSRNSETGQSALDFLRNRLGPTVTAATPFAETIVRIRYAQKQYPYGLALISLTDYEALIGPSPTIVFAPSNAGLPADLCLDLDAWRRQLPDFEEESQVVVLELMQPILANTAIPRQALRLNPVYPLTTRGAEILRIEKPAIALKSPDFEKTFVGPLVRERALTERDYNAQKLAELVFSKPSKQVLATCQLLKQAWEIRQNRQLSVSPNPACHSFWDYLLDYDRTGEKALAIANTDQGYLQDLLQIIGRYLKYTRLIPGQMQEAEFKQVVHSWSTLANDPQLNETSFKVFTSKASKVQAETVEYVNNCLGETGVAPLLTGFIFLRLRRELGDLEQNLTRKKLQDYEKTFSKNKGEMYAGLYATGLLFSFRTFVNLYEQYAAQPLKVSIRADSTIPPTLFSAGKQKNIVLTSNSESENSEASSNTHIWGGDEVKPTNGI